jgi:hypothetical protein
LSVTLFEKESLIQVLNTTEYNNMTQTYSNQLNLFEY